MNKGIRSGWGPQPGIAVPRYPKRLAIARNTVTAQTVITTEVDLSGLSISFAVTLYPVKVRLYAGYVYGSGTGNPNPAIRITDNSNVVMVGALQSLMIGIGDFLYTEEEILIPGSYQRKGRIFNNSGSGNANTLPTAEYAFWLEAIEFTQ